MNKRRTEESPLKPNEKLYNNNHEMIVLKKDITS